MDTDVYEVLIELIANIDTQFQLWLTITSAFIVAHYFAGHRLGPWIRTYLSLIYLCSCVLILFRLILVSEVFRELLEANPGTAFADDSAGLAGFFRLIVIMFGTLGAIVYSVFHSRITGPHHSEKTVASEEKHTSQ